MLTSERGMDMFTKIMVVLFWFVCLPAIPVFLGHREYMAHGYNWMVVYYALLVILCFGSGLEELGRNPSHRISV